MNSPKIMDEKRCASCNLVNTNDDLYCNDCNKAVDESNDDEFKQKIADVIKCLKEDDVLISKYGIIGTKYGLNNEQINKMDAFRSALELIDCYDNIWRAFIEIPNILNKRVTINRTSSSYGLKHVLENYINKKNKGGFYISNGEFIVAMLMHGYKYKIYPPVVVGQIWPNMYFNYAIKK